MSRPTLVRTEVREEFVDMAGNVHPTYAAAHRASVAGLLAAFLVDQGVSGAEAIAWAVLGSFTVVPRDPK